MLTLFYLSFGQFVAVQLQQRSWMPTDAGKARFPCTAASLIANQLLRGKCGKKSGYQQQKYSLQGASWKTIAPHCHTFPKTDRISEFGAEIPVRPTDCDWEWERQSHGVPSGLLGAQHWQRLCPHVPASRGESQGGSFHKWVFPLVKTWTGLAHSGPRCVVPNSLTHVLVPAAQDFLIGTLSFKSPKIMMYDYSMARVFIQLKICWTLLAQFSQNPSKYRCL